MKELRIQLSDEEYEEFMKQKYLTLREHILLPLGINTQRRKPGRKTKKQD